MTVQEILDMLDPAKEYSCTYGSLTGRNEEYSIDREAMSGYSSSGYWDYISLDSEDFNPELLIELREHTVIYKRTNYDTK